MDGWDSCTDHDFYVRAYNNRLESKRFLVKRYATANQNVRRFKILGTAREVTINRCSPTATRTHTMSVPEHFLDFDPQTSTEEIVCTALYDDDFILEPDNANVKPLF